MWTSCEILTIDMAGQIQNIAANSGDIKLDTEP